MKIKFQSYSLLGWLIILHTRQNRIDKQTNIRDFSSTFLAKREELFGDNNLWSALPTLEFADRIFAKFHNFWQTLSE